MDPPIVKPLTRLRTIAFTPKIVSFRDRWKRVVVECSTRPKMDKVLVERLIPVEGSELPRSRRGHAACVIHKNLYIFGGFHHTVSQNIANEVLDDVWRYNFDSRQWQMMNFKQGFIPSLDGMSIVEASNGQIYLLGGHCISSVVSYLAPNVEVYKIDFSTLSVQIVPQPSVNHDRDWQSLVWACAAFGPSKDRIYTFGGRTISMIYSSELRTFNITTGVWTTIRPRPENTIRPTARASASLTLLPNNKEFLVFGGRSRGEESRRTYHFNDVYIYDIESNTWRFQSTWGEPPRGRAGHSATLLPSGTHLFIYGGYQYELLPEYMNDAFVLDLRTWEWRRLDLRLHHNSANDTEIPVKQIDIKKLGERMEISDEEEDDLEEFDGSDDEYDRCAVDLALAGHSMHLIGDVIYIFGGETAIYTETRLKGQFSSREVYCLHLPQSLLDSALQRDLLHANESSGSSVTLKFLNGHSIMFPEPWIRRRCPALLHKRTLRFFEASCLLSSSSIRCMNALAYYIKSGRCHHLSSLDVKELCDLLQLSNALHLSRLAQPVASILACCFDDRESVTVSLLASSSEPSWVLSAEEHLCALLMMQLRNILLQSRRLSRARRLPGILSTISSSTKREIRVVQNQMSRLRNSVSTTGDFEIHVAQASLKSHRFVLAARSNYFAALLSSGMSEVTQGRTIISPSIFVHTDAAEDSHRPRRIVKKIIKFMYSGRLSASFESLAEIIELLEAASFCGLINLSSEDLNQDFLQALLGAMELFWSLQTDEERKVFSAELAEHSMMQDEGSPFRTVKRLFDRISAIDT